MEKKELVFNNIGKNVSEFESYDEMIDFSGLDYEVGKTEAYALIPGTDRYEPIPNKIAVYNKTSGLPVSVMGSTYNIIQNRDAFSIIRPYFGHIKPVWSGSVNNGAIAFMQCELQQPDIAVGQDKTKRYLFICNSHDGSSALRITFMPIRQVCNNMLPRLLGMKSTASVRHTLNNSSEMLQLETVLQNEMLHTQQLNELFRELGNFAVNDNQINDVVNQLVMTEDEFGVFNVSGIIDKEQISARKRNIIGSMKDYVNYGVGQDMHTNTALWLFNGISSYYQNYNPNKNAFKQLTSVMEGSVNRQTLKAIELIKTICIQ